MTMRSQTLARGPGWHVLDLLYNAGPRDRPFEEQHETVCIAAVTQGTFQYRSAEENPDDAKNAQRLQA
jgi:AraC family transcriptional regulator